MAHQPVCLVCKQDMAIGFLTDVGEANLNHLPRWCPGEPQTGFLSGEAAHAQRKKGLKVTAYRCPECHALRLYAFGET